MEGLFNYCILYNMYDQNNLIQQDSSVKPNDERSSHMMREKSRRDREKKMVHKMKNTINRIKPYYFKNNSTKANIITNMCDLIIYMHEEKRQLEEKIMELKNRQKILDKQNRDCFIIACHYRHNK